MKFSLIAEVNGKKYKADLPFEEIVEEDRTVVCNVSLPHGICDNPQHAHYEKVSDSNN